MEPLEDRLAPATLPAGFSESLVASGLSRPTTMAFAPDGRLFVAEENGTLRVVKNGTLLATPFVTLAVDSNGERGLLGVTFDPNFAVNGFVYVYYTATTPNLHNRVSRFTANGDVAVAGSEVDLLDLDPLVNTIHNGGAIHFGPDGKLYVAVGENGISANSQTLSNRLGKMLRINADGSIPTDNPFYNVATGANRAIWALGLRNPFTFDFQPGTGRMFINDVGFNTWEEIDEGFAGANYGWPNSEGFRQPTDQRTTIGTYHDPLFEYGHGAGTTLGTAIVGAAFYDPTIVQYPAYVGDYFFADIGNGWIRDYDPRTGAVNLFASGITDPVEMAVGPDGALYYLSGAAGINGQVYRLQLGAGPRVVASSVSGDVFQASGVANVRLSFDRPIDPSTFMPAAVSLSGPAGPITGISVQPVTGGSNEQFDVSFPTQTALGTYTLVLAPTIKDQAGNAMDQNADGVTGDGDTITFTLHFRDDFATGAADGFRPQSGNWSVSGGAYHATPIGGGDAVSTLQLGTPLPASLQLSATMTATAGGNAYFVFDYAGPTSFKFAGFDVAAQQWQIGHRDATGWHVDASIFDPSITAGVATGMTLQIVQGETAVLLTGVIHRVSFTFAGLIGSGADGLGTRNSAASFQAVGADVVVPPLAALPLTEDLASNPAVAFTPRAGSWNGGGAYHATPSPGGDAISTLLLLSVPSNMAIATTVTAGAAAGGYRSNAFIVFDYEGANNFKFAGFDVTTQQWEIGHRDAIGWHVDTGIFDPSIRAGAATTLTLQIIQGETAVLSTGVIHRISFTYGTNVLIGFVGLGTNNALAGFAGLQVQAVVPALSPVPLAENFVSSTAVGFTPRAGSWNGGAGYHATPSPGGDAVSTLILGSVPANLQLSTTVSTSAAGSGYGSNAAIVFDYEGPTSFKFAGFDVTAQQWEIGHRDATGWHVDAGIFDPAISAGVTYGLTLTLVQGETAVLSTGATHRVSFTYGTDVRIGFVGLGTDNALANFQALQASVYVPPLAALPVSEDLANGPAVAFTPRVGSWNSGGAYRATPSPGGDTISTLLLASMPPSLQIGTTATAGAAFGGYGSNAYLVFDYEGPSSFKFAGFDVAAQQWQIGHRDNLGWHVDAAIADVSIAAGTPYSLSLQIQAGTASLTANGTPRVSFSYGTNLTIGFVGLGTRNALASFGTMRAQ